MCIFSPLSITVYEWVQWMWRMSKQSGVDVENERVEWMEQIWSGWSKFGVGGVKFGVGGADVDRTTWRVADNLEKTLRVSVYFCGQFFLIRYICDRT